MERMISRRSFLKGAAATAIGAAFMGLGNCAQASAESVSYTPGTYTASAQGISSQVTVTMTFSENAITDVIVDSSGETANIGAAAQDKLADQLMAAQSASIDGVSGASVTSSAVKTAAQNCIDQATGVIAAAAAEEAAPAEGGEGGGEGGGQGGPGGGGGGATLDVDAAKAAAKAENRTWGYAGAGDWLGTPDDVTIAKTIGDYDVVVIGAGHAGTQATLAAAEAGAKVACLEKNTMLQYLGEDVGAWNSQFHADAGFPKYNLGEVINEFVTRSGGKASQEVVAAYVNNSGETLDHMIECMKEAVEDPTVNADYKANVEKYGLSGNEYISGGTYEEDIDSSYYTYDVTRNGKIIIQAMFDPDYCNTFKDKVDWNAIEIGESDGTEEGYKEAYAALYDTCAEFYDNNNQCIDHVNYPKAPGTKSWATTVQFMGHFHGREGHGGVAASSIVGNVEMACMTKAIEQGAELYLGYKGYKLLQDEDGTVTGVIAYDADADQYVQFNCKAVISCGGGYVQNSDMCWALLNELQERYERLGGLKEDFNGGFMAANCDGSATKMACWGGAMIEPSPRGHMHLGGGPSGTWGCNCHLWLDENMERFCNEGNITAADVACARKKGNCYGILGGDYLKHVSTCGLEHTGPNFGRPEYIMDFIYDIETGAVDSQINVTGMTTAERMGGGIVKASSLESLASLLGIEDTDKFVAAVEAYNELCTAVQNGEYTCDPQFGKNAEAMVPIEGPIYYGFSGSLGDSATSPSMVTMSGLMTDKNLMCVTAAGDSINGLFAAGNDLGGRYGTGYNTPCAGNSIGMAVTHGRVAGKAAAAYCGL